MNCEHCAPFGATHAVGPERLKGGLVVSEPGHSDQHGAAAPGAHAHSLEVRCNPAATAGAAGQVKHLQLAIHDFAFTDVHALRRVMGL